MSKIEDFENRVNLALRPAHNDDFVSHRASWREALVIARDSAKVAPPDTDDKAYWERELRAYDRAFSSYATGVIPEDFETHRLAWREALEIARAQAKVSAPDVDDKAYWTHELAAFDRAFESIGEEQKLPQSLEEQLRSVPGQVLGSGMPDWPADLTTFKERQGYQRGVAHARFLAQHTHAEEMRVAATVARYREESIRDNLGSRDEFLEMCEHDDAVRKLSEIVWEFNGFSTEVAKVNGVAIGHVALRGRPDYDDAYEVILYNSAGEKDAPSGKSVPAAIAHVGPGQDKPRFLKMAEEALANGTPSNVFTVLRGKIPETNHLGTREKLADASQVFDTIEKANEPLRQAGLPLYGELVAALAEVAKKVPFCPEQDAAARLVEQVKSAGGVQSAARTRMRP